jgi:hypothetical protein
MSNRGIRTGLKLSNSDRPRRLGIFTVQLAKLCSMISNLMTQGQNSH